MRALALLVLDLRELSHVDRAGVDALARATSGACSAGRRLILLRGPPDVDRIFWLTESTRDVELFDLDPGSPPVLVLLELARRDRASR